MVKLSQSLSGDVEYFSHLLKKAVICKVTQLVTKEVFLLKCTMNFPIHVFQQLFHSFEVGYK